MCYFYYAMAFSISFLLEKVLSGVLPFWPVGGGSGQIRIRLADQAETRGKECLGIGV